jgi:hypothetical protein
MRSKLANAAMKNSSEVINEESSSSSKSAIPEAGAIVGRLSDVWDEWAQLTGKGSGEFIEKVFGTMWGDGDTGDAHAENIRNWQQEPDDLQPFALLEAAMAACAYAAQAIKAEKAGDLVAAWCFTAKGNYWLGITVGAWSVRRESTASTKKATDARHAENRAMKAQVLAWYAKHAGSFSSKDDAAQAAAGTIVPVKFRTVRDWLKQSKP